MHLHLQRACTDCASVFGTSAADIQCAFHRYCGMVYAVCEMLLGSRRLRLRRLALQVLSFENAPRWPLACLAKLSMCTELRVSAPLPCAPLLGDSSNHARSFSACLCTAYIGEAYMAQHRQLWMGYLGYLHCIGQVLVLYVSTSEP